MPGDQEFKGLAMTPRRLPGNLDKVWQMNCSIVASNNLPGDLEWKVWQCGIPCIFNNFNSAKMYIKVHFAGPKPAQKRRVKM